MPWKNYKECKQYAKFLVHFGFLYNNYVGKIKIGRRGTTTKSTKTTLFMIVICIVEDYNDY